MKATLIATCLLLAAANAAASEVVVSLKNIAFSVKTLDVRVGDKVTFLNEDPVRHNVYSPTEPDSFDLGAYATGQSRSVSFQAEGEHEVKCSIHVNMKLTITVKK